MAQHAPGKHYRNGLSLVDVMRKFPDDAAAEAWIVQQRWPDGIRCPRCDSDNVQSNVKHPSMPYRCRLCRKFFSYRTGTVMQGSNLGAQVWVVATPLPTTTRSMSFAACQQTLRQTIQTMGVLPWDVMRIIDTDGYSVSRVCTSDGSILITCNGPDRKMAVTKSPYRDGCPA